MTGCYCFLGDFFDESQLELPLVFNNKNDALVSGLSAGDMKNKVQIGYRIMLLAIASIFGRGKNSTFLSYVLW